MNIPRGLRRFAVLAMYGSYVAATVIQWRLRSMGANRQLILGLFLTSFAIGALLFATTNYLVWTGAKDDKLDEREIAVRDGIFRKAYGIMAWLSVLLVAIWYAAPASLTPATNGHVLFWGYVLLISTLPASLLAWKDRPAP